MILEEIVDKRKKTLEAEMRAVPPEEVRRRAETCGRPTLDFTAALRVPGLSVIAEVKKASPSKGLICPDFHPVEIARAYERGGASALSVLTEQDYFQGSARYLKEVRQAVGLPILRKDFLIDPYQLYETRAMGADAVLLIAAVLDTTTLRAFRELGESLGLSCLTEVHCETELESALQAGCRLIGINNRDLRTFRVDLDTTRRLAGQVPKECTVVSESGMKTAEDLRTVHGYGADAVLIGETLMRSGDPEAALRILRGKP